MLITGGAGFIGRHIVDGALGEGFEVSVLDNLSTGRPVTLPDGVTLHQVDLRDRDAVRETVLHVRPDVISHHAAQVSVSRSVARPFEDAEVNVMGSLHLLEAAREAGTGHLIFASSGGAIHGEVPEGSQANADWPARPISPYAVSKLATETYLEAYRVQHGLQSTVLRYANVYGPGQSPHGEAGVVAIFLDRLLSGQPIQINARPGDFASEDGCVRDYVYVGDVVRANLLAASGGLPDLMEVCTGEATSTLYLAETLARLSGRSLNWTATGVRAGDIGRSVLDPRSCQRALKTLTSLEEGLRQTVASWAAVRPEAGPTDADLVPAG